MRHCAGCVRNLLLAGFCHESAGCVRDLLDRSNGNLAADGVRNLLVADFGNHASAGDGLFNHLGAPFAAADRTTRTLHADGLCAAWIAWINNALLNDRTWDMTCFRHPFATAFLNGSAFRNRLADRIAYIFVAGL